MSTERLPRHLRYGDVIQHTDGAPDPLVVLRVIDDGHPNLVTVEGVTLTDTPKVRRATIHRRIPVAVYNADGDDFDTVPDYGNPFGREGA